MIDAAKVGGGAGWSLVSHYYSLMTLGKLELIFYRAYMFFSFWRVWRVMQTTRLNWTYISHNVIEMWNVSKAWNTIRKAAKALNKHPWMSLWPTQATLKSSFYQWKSVNKSLHLGLTLLHVPNQLYIQWRPEPWQPFEMAADMPSVNILQLWFYKMATPWSHAACISLACDYQKQLYIYVVIHNIEIEMSIGCRTIYSKLGWNKKGQTYWAQQIDINSIAQECWIWSQTTFMQKTTSSFNLFH